VDSHEADQRFLLLFLEKEEYHHNLTLFFLPFERRHSAKRTQGVRGRAPSKTIAKIEFITSAIDVLS
jgi:hypothetical protein